MGAIDVAISICCAYSSELHTQHQSSSIYTVNQLKLLMLNTACKHCHTKTNISILSFLYGLCFVFSCGNNKHHFTIKLYQLELCQPQTHILEVGQWVLPLVEYQLEFCQPQTHILEVGQEVLPLVEFG